MEYASTGWVSLDPFSSPPNGPCLYALEAIELFSKSNVLLWKLGRTRDLRRRLRGYSDPVAVRFVLAVDDVASLAELERELLVNCPFPRVRGREWFRASAPEMRSWLEGACDA